MNQRNAFLRGAAVASALVLMGTFVAYRAGAFTKPAEPLPQPQPEQTTASQQSQPELLSFRTSSAPRSCHNRSGCKSSK
jgi:hypothetical protein